MTWVLAVVLVLTYLYLVSFVEARETLCDPPGQNAGSVLPCP